MEIEKLNSKFASTARQNAVSEHLIARIKGLSILAGEDINSCRTHDSRVAELKQFLKKHPQNILLQVDKTPDLIYVEKSEYFEKINDFLGENFERLNNYTGAKLNKDLESYRELIQKTFGKSLPKKTLEDMHPPSSISDFYGQYKVHKENMPIRGIVTSYKSIVCNSEEYIKELLAPIDSECNYSLNSLADFKQKFLLDKTKFNEIEHKIITADIINMYPNVNVPRTISHI